MCMEKGSESNIRRTIDNFFGHNIHVDLHKVVTLQNYNPKLS